MKNILGLMTVAGLLFISVPSEHAQAMSLSNPATASTTKVASENVTTEVRWRRFHRWHRHHRHHRWHRRHWY